MGKSSVHTEDYDQDLIDRQNDRLSRSFDPCLPLMFRLKGTVVLKIWWKLLLMIFYTLIVVCLHNYVDSLKMNFPLTLVPVLGVATGLVLAFRTNTAYSRYWEGRKLWSQMVQNIRSLTLCIWAGVAGGDEEDKPIPVPPGDANENESENVKKEREKFIEKISAINLLIAFVYATKNYLRGEYSYDEGDMKGLISHLPRFQTPSSNQPFSAQAPYKPHCKKHKGPPFGVKNVKNSHIAIDVQDVDDEVKKMGSRSSFLRGDKTKNSYTLKAHDFVVPCNVPIELIYYLFTYLKHVGSKGACDAIVMRYMYGSLLALIECLTGFERILRTPIPLAYSVHLHYCIWLYLLSLPYQLVGGLNWLTIPAVGLASFALLGILRIGWEIENPFGYEENDLPLEDFCKVIRREIQVIVGHRLPTLESWTMSKENCPMAPNSSLHAQELCEKSLTELRHVLAKGTSTFPCSV